MSAECGIHGTDLLWESNGDGPSYCPSCHVDRLTKERNAALEALKTIKRDYGKVCAEFEICHHDGCQSSYGAWATADQSIKDIETGAIHRED